MTGVTLGCCGRSQRGGGGRGVRAGSGRVQLRLPAAGGPAGAGGAGLGLRSQRGPAGVLPGLSWILPTCCWISVFFRVGFSRLRPCVQVLLFDFGSEVYLWQGRDVPPCRRGVALQLTQQVWSGAYDYSNCRVNPLDPTRCNPSMPL